MINDFPSTKVRNAILSASPLSPSPLSPISLLRYVFDRVITNLNVPPFYLTSYLPKDLLKSIKWAISVCLAILFVVSACTVYCCVERLAFAAGM